MVVLLCLAFLSLTAAAPACALKAAAAAVDITPDLKRHKIYLAGYGAKGRKPAAVHDALHARILLLADGKRRVGIVGLDWLGIYRNDVEEIRRRAGFEGPDRYLMIAATHNHAGPDTLGLWGPLIGVSGVDLEYHRETKARVVEALKSLEAKLEDATLSAAAENIDPRGLCKDLRNPTVIDPQLGVLRLRARSGKTIATVVNWSCHPELLNKYNPVLSADFPGPLCAKIEKEAGGACVYLSGSIGGLMTPDLPLEMENLFGVYELGNAVAEKALALAARAPASSSGVLEARARIIRVPVENSRYLAFLPALAFGHRLLDARGDELPAWKKYWLPLRHLVSMLGPDARPWVESEVSVLAIGPARLLGIPGEIFPELVIGGYDGRYRFGHDLIAKNNPDPPDLSKAPKAPYLRELTPGRVRLVVGLANDELGYIVPEYDFKARPNRTMLPRMPGHHYEETNSIGPSATKIIVDTARELLRN